MRLFHTLTIGCDFCYNNSMKVTRRLLLLLAAALSAYSAWWQWYGLWPASTSLNSLLTHASFAGITLSVELFNHITLAHTIFALAFVVLLAAVTGFRSISWISIFLQVIIILFVTFATGSSIDTLASIHAGNGPWIMIGTCILIIVIILFPKRRPKEDKK